MRLLRVLIFHKTYFFLILSFLTSCGYAPVGKKQMHVACLVHDSDGFDGRFLPDLQYALLQYGIQMDADHVGYILHIQLNKDHIDQIGYRYDINPSTQGITNRLIANEERRIVGAKIWIEREGIIIFGPKEIEGYAQYDFIDPDAANDVSFIDSSGNRVTSLDFSLGQLDAMEGARRISDGVASQNLAKKIASIIAHTSFSK